MFQPSAQRDLTVSQVRYIALANGFGTLVAVGAFWGMWLLVLIASYFNLEYKSRAGTTISATSLLWLAVIITVLGALWLLPTFWRAVYLARRGLVEVGTVRRRLGVTWRGIETILVTYTIDNRAYAIKRGEAFRTFAVGERVRVVFDPEKPQCALLADQVFDGKVGR